MKRTFASLVVVFLLVTASSSVYAQSDLGLKGVGFEIGMVSPEDLDATVGLGFFTDFGTIVPRLMLEGYVDFWTTSENVAGVEASATDVVVGAKGKWVFPTSNPKIQPFAGGGLGVHFVRAEFTIPDQWVGGFLIPGVSGSDTSTKLGLDFGGGMNVMINEKTDFVSELWYGVVSDVNQLSIKVGILYKMGI